MRHLGLVGEVVVGSRLRQWMPLDVLEEALAQYRRLGSGHKVRGRSLLDDVPEGVVGSGLVEHYNSALETRRQERAQKIEQVAKHLSGPVLAHGGSPIGHRIRFGVLVLLAVMLLGFGGWQLLDILGSGR
jgi:hypothetical protein